ncbi:MAG: subtilisin, partial [Gammaproteobacteria bacterium]
MHRVIRQLSIVFLLLGPFWAVSVFSEPSSSEPSSAETLEVIVKFGVEPVAAYVPNLDPIDLQRAAIIRASNQFVSKLNSPQTELLAKFQFIPFAAVKVDRSTLDKLLADPMVLSYEPVEEFHTSLSQSVSLINAPTLWSSGVEGLNQVVAVIDTGVESSHPFMAGKIIDEACFVSSSDCPNGQQTQFGVGAADPLGKPHGTHVAGIVAGRSGDRDGVARSAQIMAIQVFQAGGGASSVDIVRALEYVY